MVAEVGCYVQFRRSKSKIQLLVCEPIKERREIADARVAMFLTRPWVHAELDGDEMTRIIWAMIKKKVCGCSGYCVGFSDLKNGAVYTSVRKYLLFF